MAFCTMFACTLSKLKSVLDIAAVLYKLLYNRRKATIGIGYQ